MIGKRQKVRVLSVVKGSLSKNTKAGEADSSDLRPWNSLYVVTYHK